MSRWTVVRVCAISIGVLVTLITPLSAQTGLSGQIDGIVTDESGKPLPEARVTLTGSKLMGSSTAATEANGAFHFISLNPGPDYSLKFEANGYEPVATKGVPVSIRATTSVNIKMKISQSREVLTGGAANLTDAGSARRGQSIGNELTAETPKTDGFGVIAVAVGVVRDSPSVGGSSADLTQQSSTNGTQTSKYNINGGETQAGNGNGRYGNFDSYVETVVETSGAGADVRRGGGGFQGDLVSKIGSNAFHGNFNAAFYNDNFEGDNLNARLTESGITDTKDVVTFHDITAQVGGPIMKDQLWFFSAVRKYRVVRKVLGQEHDQVGVLSPSLNAAFDFKANANNRFQFYWGYDPKQDYERALDRFHDFNASGSQQAWSRTIQGKSWHTLGQRTVLETQAFYFAYWWPTYPQEGSGAPATNSTTKYFFQGETEANIIRHPERWEGSASITHNVAHMAGGSHEFKLGGDLARVRIHDITGFGNGSTTTVSGNSSDPDTVYTYKNDAKGIQIPSQVKLDNGPTGPDSYVNDVTIYGQDRMNVGRFTVNYGARWDRYNAWRPAQCQNSNARWASLFGAACFDTQDSTLMWNNISPRLSAVYKLKADGTVLIKGSFGLYPTEMIPTTTDPVNPNITLSNTYNWLGDLNGNGRLDFPTEVGTLTSTARQKNNTFKSFHNPNVDEQGVGFEMQLPMNIAFRSNYYYTRYLGQLVTANIGIPAAAFFPTTITDPGANGAGLPGHLVPGNPTVAAHTITVYNVDKAYVANSVSTLTNFDGSALNAHSFDMTLQKRLSNGWQMLASYNYNHFPYTRITDPEDQNAIINNQGISPLQTANTLKVNGSYLFQKIGVQIGLNWLLRQGQGYDRLLTVTGLNQGTFTIVADAPGTWHYDKQNQIDLKFVKNFTLSQGRRFGVTLDGYNLTNAAPVTILGGAGINNATGVAFGQIAHTTPPRVFRLGARFTF